VSETRQQIDACLVLDLTPALIFSARPDGYLDFFNERWLEWLGVPIEKIVGWAWIDAIHPDDRNKLIRRWQEAIASGSPAISEARVRRANGEYRWMLHHSVPQRDESGSIVRWFGLKNAEGADTKLYRLYPRDFWMP
jgi:PAS domain S-box-containing protein